MGLDQIMAELREDAKGLSEPEQADLCVSIYGELLNGHDANLRRDGKYISFVRENPTEAQFFVDYLIEFLRKYGKEEEAQDLFVQAYRDQESFTTTYDIHIEQHPVVDVEGDTVGNEYDFQVVAPTLFLNDTWGQIVLYELEKLDLKPAYIKKCEVKHGGETILSRQSP